MNIYAFSTHLSYTQSPILLGRCEIQSILLNYISHWNQPFLFFVFTKANFIIFSVQISPNFIELSIIVKMNLIHIFVFRNEPKQELIFFLLILLREKKPPTANECMQHIW